MSPVVLDVLRSPGRPLDPATRGFLEPRFAHDFSRIPAHAAEPPIQKNLAVNRPDDPLEREADRMAARALDAQADRAAPGADFSRVRIHADAQAAESARAVDAQAYTVGHHVVFGAGRYAPETAAGRGLLAHELSHVVQQARPAAAQDLLQRRGFFESAAIFFGVSEGTFDEKELTTYLANLGKTRKRSFDSDNKARAVVRRWKAGDAAFELSAEQKVLLIQEMQSGFTGDEDEEAILDLLENSENGDLRVIFGSGGVGVKDLNSDFHGAEWKRLQAFYASRFAGGLSALLQGKVDPIGAPGAGAPRFPYKWIFLKAKLEGPYTVPEIVSDLGAFSQAEQNQALKDLGTERVRLNRQLSDLVSRHGAAQNAAQKQLLKDRALALKDAVTKIDVILQTVFKGTALAETPASLTGKTKVPTAAEKTEIQKALKPDLKTDSSGAALPFVAKLPGETKNYEDKLRDYMPSMIQTYYDKTVAGRGPAEHGDPTKVHSLQEMEDLGNVSKRETDAVFGQFKTGPALKADRPGKRGNIHDLWQDTENDLKKMTKDQRREMARALLFYFFQSDRGVLALNQAHNADPQFTEKLAPDKVTRKSVPVNTEAKILDKLVGEFAKTNAQVKKLNEIDRGWDASAGDGHINIQLFKPSTAPEDQDFLWDMFQTLIHEYLHTLVHDKYETHAKSFGGTKTNQYNTLIEGVDSLLTEVVWTNVEPRVNDPALRTEVEGPVYAKLPAIKVKPASRRRYASYAQAIKLVNIVGIRNVYAAYFLGDTDKIGA